MVEVETRGEVKWKAIIDTGKKVNTVSLEPEAFEHWDFFVVLAWRMPQLDLRTTALD